MREKYLNVFVNHPTNSLMHGSAKMSLGKDGNLILKMKSGTTFKQVGLDYFNAPLFGFGGVEVVQPKHILYPNGFNNWSYPVIFQELTSEGITFTFHRGDTSLSVDVRVQYE